MQKTDESMSSVEQILDEIGGANDNNVKVVVRSTDMNDAKQAEAANCIVEALNIHYKETEVAKMVKAHFDTKYGRSWQCIVGKHFARYVALV